MLLFFFAKETNSDDGFSVGWNENELNKVNIQCIKFSHQDPNLKKKKTDKWAVATTYDVWERLKYSNVQVNILKPIKQVANQYTDTQTNPHIYNVK